MKRTIFIIGISILLQSCLVSRTSRPKLTGFVFDMETNEPINGCNVGESTTNLNGYYELKEIRYKQIAFPGMEASPIFVREIVKKEGYASDTIKGFNRFGGGMRKDAHWEMDTIFLKKNLNTVKNVKKITLKEGRNENVSYKDLNINILLQVYGEDTKAHLIGDVNVNIMDNPTDHIITSYYIDADDPGKVYYTQLFKNYFITFESGNDNHYVILEEAKAGFPFALHQKEGLVENLNLKISNSFHEWSDDGAQDIHQTLELSVGNTKKEVAFFSSEISADFFFEIDQYRVIPLSTSWQPHTIEFIVKRITD